MQVTLTERDENNIVTIDIETDAGYAKEEYSKVARKFAEHMNIPGFRKGKVPTKVVEKQVGPDALKAETLNFDFLSKILHEAIQEKELEVVFIPNIEKVDLENPEAAVKLSAKLELFPEFELADFSKLTAEVEVPKFDLDKYVGETLERLAQQFTEFTEDADAAIEMGDEIVLDFDGSYKDDEGNYQAQEGMKAEAYQVVVKPGQFIENFLEQMVGMKVGDEKDIDVKFPEQYHAENLAGRDARFAVKVHKISKPSTPEINDELAKKAESEDLGELKAKITDEITKVNDRQKDALAGEKLLEELTKASKIEIPSTMVEREMKQNFEGLKQQMQWDDAKLEEHKASLNMDEQTKETTDRLAKSMAVTKIIKSNDLTNTPEEVEEGVREFLQTQQYLPPNLDFSGLQQRVGMDLLTNKAIKMVIDGAKVTYKEVEELAAAA